MSDHGHDHDHDHDHARTVKPMVDEITDFEVLEIALRELCIEKGLFTAEQHRVFTEYAEQIGPTPAARLVAKAWLDPEFKLALTDAMAASKEVGVDWLDPTRVRHAQRLHAFKILEDTPAGPPRDRVRAVLVLPAADSGQIAGVVPHPELSPPHRALAATGAQSSDWNCLRALRSGSRTPTRSTGSWSCRCARRAPRGGARTN